MSTSISNTMGKVTTTITITNFIDEMLAERGLMPTEQIRSITLADVLVDTGATRLCLPADVIKALGLAWAGEIEVKTAVGLQTVRIFKGLSLHIEGREGQYTCVELPGGTDPLVGLIPLEDLGLEPDLHNQRLRHLPMAGQETYLTIL